MEEPRAYTELDAAVDGYLSFLKVERNLSKNTLEAYSRDLADLLDRVTAQGVITPAALNSAVILEWLSALSRSGLKPRSQARMLVAVRGFTRYLAREKVLPEDPARIIQLPKSGKPLPQFDTCCALLSLPRLFKTLPETIPAQVPYLYADPEKARHWQERLSAEGAAFKVGLVWATQSASGTAKARTLELDAFAPLAAVPGVVFCSLQKGPAASHAARPPQGMRILDAGAEL